MVGSQIGNYRIEEKLGEGGMGVVYRAVDVNLDRVVAIKALNTELRGNAELEQRFRAEAKAQANLNHTNLAILYALLIEDGRPWMVMEFIEGETLEQMIQRRGPIPAEEAIALFRQALLGIGYAHRMGIVHRDIKPSNIMVNRQGIVKVMDFGIAKVLGGRGMTRTGTQMGTAFYMSPEQVLNRGVDIRSDIYSLGVTLYEMLTANVPFSGDSDYQIMNDHVNTPPPLLTKFYPYVPAGVQNAVLKAIAKRQDDRFQTVEEFGAALERPHDFGIVPGMAAAAPAIVPQPVPPRPAGTVVETAPRYTAPSIPMPALAPAPVSPAAGAIHQPVSPQRMPARTREKIILGGGIAAVLVIAASAAWFTLRPAPTQDTSLPLLPPAANTGQHISPGTPPSVIQLSSRPAVIAPPPTQPKNTPSSGRPQVPQNRSQPFEPPAPQTNSNPSNQHTSAPAAPPPAAPTPAAAPLVIPVGTPVAIRTISPVDTSVNRPGERFDASVDEPIVVDGRVVVPRGASAKIVLANETQAGHIEGRNSVSLQLVALTFGGYNYPVRSSTFQQEGASRGKRSAEVIGGGAAVGAVIGGIFGHGKGAAAGAAAGAGAGTGAQYATKAAPVVIPSETRIDFTLRTPINVVR
ncbi:MAG TPA: protein kinase [Bryobacteraceae bacterium]|nr:protein kinase [Bryobacteraceae bacterium]